MGRRGPAPGQGGRPPKPLAEKVLDGNPGKRKLTVVEFPNAAEFQGSEMPQPSAMLSAVQKDGTILQAGEIYKTTWNWLDKRGCALLVSPQVLERYSMMAARWIHCEEIITKTGYLAKHPTTSMAIQSPYVAMSQNYMAQTNRLWYEIFQIVKENCSSDYTGVNPQDDVMERLLTARTK
ncbi:hypothetical protein SDC9_60294 [bioreactor metagenome]|uniref:Terminase n=1 Tax=bioreactor metagenome TaxID=1076179 RepID=A0A644XIL0_9ZZZZ